MKKQLRFGCVLFASLLTFGSKAQSYTQSFDDVTTLAASGWSLNNLSTPIGTVPNWFQGDVTVFPGFLTGYIGVNYNSVAAANTISNWMISPVTNLSNGSTITFYSRTVASPAFPDRLQVRLSTNGASTNVGATNTSVGDFTTALLEINSTLTTVGYPNTWTQYTATISGLAAPTTGRIAFRYFVTNGGPSGANSDYIGVDQFAYNDINVTNPDLSVLSVNKEYTVIPLTQATAMNLGGVIRNTTPNAATNAQLKVNVYQAPNFTTPLYTQTSPAAALAGNTSSAPISLGTYTPTAVGNYRYQYTSICTGNVLTAADTMNYDFEISPNLYARDNGIVSTAIGIGAGPVGYMGSKFTVTASTELDSVIVVFDKTTPGPGDSTRVVIFNFNLGLPNAIVGTSNAYTFTAADGLAGLDEKVFQLEDLTGNTLVLAPGDYLVAAVEYDSILEIANVVEIFTPNTQYVSWPGQAWAATETFGSPFDRSLLIRPYLSPVCPATFGTDVQSSCSPFVWLDGNTYTSSNNTAQFTLTSVNGCDSIVTLNLSVGSPTSSTDAQVACGPYTWIDGNTYTTANNTAQFVVPNSSGCDSTITLNLTFTTAINTTDNQTACDVFSWIDGNAYSTNNNTAQVTLTSVNGCDSIVTLNLVILGTTPSGTVIDNGDNTLTASGGTTFEWIDCATNLPIAGQTTATFAPTANGMYAAIVGNGSSCTDTTNCVVINTIGIGENATIYANIYPNPTSDGVSVVFAEGSAQLTITDMQGKIVQSSEILSNEVISLEGLQAGTYLFVISTENGMSIQRVVKK
jgi:hypothetical protein